ncbi:MAG: hypothetical protein V1839_02665 [archaeon]
MLELKLQLASNDAENKLKVGILIAPYADKWVMMKDKKTKCAYLSQAKDILKRHVWGYADMDIIVSKESMLRYKSGELSLYIAEDEAEVRNEGDLWSKMMDVYKTGESASLNRK